MVSYVLTPRETDVCDLVLLGMTNRQIGNALCITDNTVEFHLRNIFSKYGVATRTALAVLYMQQPPPGHTSQHLRIA